MRYFLNTPMLHKMEEIVKYKRLNADVISQKVINSLPAELKER